MEETEMETMRAIIKDLQRANSELASDGRQSARPGSKVAAEAEY
jgi:hypothetical protein